MNEQSKSWWQKTRDGMTIGIGGIYGIRGLTVFVGRYILKGNAKTQAFRLVKFLGINPQIAAALLLIMSVMSIVDAIQLIIAIKKAQQDDKKVQDLIDQLLNDSDEGVAGVAIVPQT